MLRNVRSERPVPLPRLLSTGKPQAIDSKLQQSPSPSSTQSLQPPAHNARAAIEPCNFSSQAPSEWETCHMARQSSLTLTEELEKLEQSITLTLQEIDHNFSRAHRIVTSSILPIVEQYAEHSREVWDGSKFWKQFFESSANVSLSGYEEQPSTHQTLDDTVTEESAETMHASWEGSESYATPSSADYSMQQHEQDVSLTSLTISPSQSTPRAATKSGESDVEEQRPAYADYPSPYEALRREVKQVPRQNQHHTHQVPSTPGASTALADQIHDITVTPDAINSPSFFSRRDGLTSIPQPSARKQADPLLHRVLDRNYRVQATPMANARHGGFQNPGVAAAAAAGVELTPVTAARNRLRESTLSSSPDVPEPPQLHPEIFSSPVRKARTPGVSVLTPRNPNTGSKWRSQRPPGNVGATTEGVWDSDDDEFNADDDQDGGLPFGQSPPKTMQFHIPQSRLLKTPAREASKRIVEDLLLTAGMGRRADEGNEDDDDTTDDLNRFRSRDGEIGRDFGDDENSPSVVRKGPAFEDESF